MKKLILIIATAATYLSASAQSVGDYLFQRKLTTGFASDYITPSGTSLLTWNGAGRITQIPRTTFLTPATAASSYVPLSRTLTINGTTFDLSANRSWTIPAGVTDHGLLSGLIDDDHPQYHNDARGDARYSLLAHTHTFASLTSKPTTIAGYGITDFNSLGDARWSLLGHTHAPADLTGFGAAGGYLRSNGSAWVRVSGVAWGDITGAPSLGDVVGPASSTDNNVPQWDGVTGKLLKDGLGISTGGNGVTDGLKLVQFNSNGGLQAAVTGGVGVLGVSSGGDGVQGTTSAGGSAALYGNTITAGCDALRLTNTGGTGKFLKAWAGGANNKLEIDLTGAISWPDGGTGPATTRTNLGLGTLATQNGTFSGTSSGTNTGDQTITLTGDVTGSGTGSFAATIANDAVTYAKIQDVTATDRLLGRSTAGAGIVEEITCTAAGRSLIDDASASAQRTTLGLGTAAVVNTGTGSGDVPTITNADARYIQQAIVDAKGDVLTATAADTPARLAVGTDGQVLTARSTESTGLVWATPVATVVSSHVNITWTNMPAAVDFIGGSNAFARVEKFDLTNATQFRVLANINVSGSASSKLIARYRTTYSTTASDYSVMGASSTEVSVAISGSAGTSADGGWIDITAAAKADVWIAFMGIDGNGTADPQFTVYFQTR